MVEKNEMHGNVPICDCDLHFGIMKSEFILGLSVEFLKFLAILLFYGLLIVFRIDLFKILF